MANNGMNKFYSVNKNYVKSMFKNYYLLNLFSICFYFAHKLKRSYFIKTNLHFKQPI